MLFFLGFHLDACFYLLTDSSISEWCISWADRQMSDSGPYKTFPRGRWSKIDSLWGISQFRILFYWVIIIQQLEGWINLVNT